MKTQFLRDGYVEVDLPLPEELIEGIIQDTDRAILEGQKTQESGYHYTASPRLFEMWKTSRGALELAKNLRVREVLSSLYGRDPIPFQTINFSKGTQQPTHSDSIHFDSNPPLLAACWVVFQDTSEETGGLVVYPGSHRLPALDFEDLGIPVPVYGEQFDAYAAYEEEIDKIANAFGEPRLITPRKGKAVIFDAHILHGGGPVLDPSSMEYSQVTHYFFEGCEKYFCPMFSRKSQGQFALKDLKEKDILNYQL